MERYFCERLNPAAKKKKKKRRKKKEKKTRHNGVNFPTYIIARVIERERDRYPRLALKSSAR